MTTPRAIITVGIPGSGKTTHINTSDLFKGFVNVNRDDMRKKILGDVRNHTAEDEITVACERLIHTAYKDRKDIVISDTNVNQWRREELVKKLHGIGFSPIIAHVFNVSSKTCLERNKERENPVPQDAIFRMEDSMWRAPAEIGPVSHGMFDDVIIINPSGTIPLYGDAPGTSTHTNISLAQWRAAATHRERENDRK